MWLVTAGAGGRNNFIFSGNILKLKLTSLEFLLCLFDAFGESGITLGFIGNILTIINLKQCWMLLFLHISYFLSNICKMQHSSY